MEKSRLELYGTNANRKHNALSTQPNPHVAEHRLFQAGFFHDIRHLSRNFLCLYDNVLESANNIFY